VALNYWTGRGRSVRFYGSWAIEGSVSYEYFSVFSGDGFAAAFPKSATARFGFGGDSILSVLIAPYGNWSKVNNPIPSPNFHCEGDYGLNASLFNDSLTTGLTFTLISGNPHYVEATYDNRTDNPPEGGPGTFRIFNVEHSGTWEVTVEADEYFTERLLDLYTSSSTAPRSFISDDVAAGNVTNVMQFGEALRSGTKVTIRVIGFPGGDLVWESQGGPVAGALDNLYLPYVNSGGRRLVTYQGIASVGRLYAQCSLRGDVGTATGLAPVSHSYSGPYASLDRDSAEVPTSGTGGTKAFLGLFGRDQYDLSAYLYGPDGQLMNEAFTAQWRTPAPGNVLLAEAVGVAGVATATINSTAYEGRVEFIELVPAGSTNHSEVYEPNTPVLSTPQRIGCVLKAGTTLEAASTTAWKRFLVGTRKWPGLGVYEDTERTYVGEPHTLAATDGWQSNNANATVTLQSSGVSGLAASSVRISASATGNQVVYTYATAHKPPMEWRHYRIRCRSVSGSALTFTLDGQTDSFLGAIWPTTGGTGANWLITTGTAGQWVERDLDILVAKPPLFGSPPDAFLVNAFSGVIAYTAWRVSGLAAGAVIEIEWIKGLTEGSEKSRVTILQGFWGSTAGLPTINYLAPDVKTLAASSNRSVGLSYSTPAWRITDAQPPLSDKATVVAAASPNGFLLKRYYEDSETDMRFLNNANVTTGVISTHDANATGSANSLSVDYQRPHEFLQVYSPGAGDIVSLAYGNTIPMRFHLTLRDRVAGAVIGSGSTQIDAAAVSTPFRAAGSGTSADEGYYTTGYPFLVHTDTTRVIVHGTVVGDNKYFDLFPPLEAALSYLYFRNTVAGKGISSDFSATNRLVFARTSGGNIYLGFISPYTSPATPTTVNTTIAGSDPWVRYARQTTQQRLWLTYESSGSVLARYSDNEGGTFSVAVTIASGSVGHPALLIRQGVQLQHYIWRTSAGAIVGVIRSSDAATVLYGPFTIVASGVADDGISITEVPARGLLVVSYMTSGGAFTSVSSVDDGKTYS
jgi:hypothetical protein